MAGGAAEGTPATAVPRVATGIAIDAVDRCASVGCPVIRRAIVGCAVGDRGVARGST
jgi:hypothetical protein